MTPTSYTLAEYQTDALKMAVATPDQVRRSILRQYAQDRGSGALTDLFVEFIGMANSVADNCREMAELLLITEGEMNPNTAEKINMPTMMGALAGADLARGISQDLTCMGCAFRLGTVANQSPITTLDADDCSNPGEVDFLCHEDLNDAGQPFRGCSGFAQLRAARKRQEAA